MESFVIQGTNPLRGTISVQGSKNAVTPILAAALLTDDLCEIRNVPRIADVFCMLEILRRMGADVAWKGKRTLHICAKNIDPKKIDQVLIKKMRSSILLLGPLSARFRQFRLYHPGGCVIGKRPVDTHVDALQKLGVRISQKGKIYDVDARQRRSAQIVLKEFSVTATENAMMLAAILPGRTIIKIAAMEPHVEDLGRFLIAMGAKITGLGTHTINIVGKRHLHGATHVVIPDHNEAATFLILGTATKSPITVKNVRSKHLELVLERLEECGARFHKTRNAITIIPPKKLIAPSKIDARIYPGIPSDVQAPFGVLATQANGTTLIFDTIYEGRLNYLYELKKMGARVKILNPHQAVISGPTKLRGRIISSLDLRAGATLIIAGLLAQGKTIIRGAEVIDRGYEGIEKRLQGIGANIKRVTDTDTTD